MVKAARRPKPHFASFGNAPLSERGLLYLFSRVLLSVGLYPYGGDGLAIDGLVGGVHGHLGHLLGHGDAVVVHQLAERRVFVVQIVGRVRNHDEELG